MLNKLILGTAQLGMPYGINNKLGKPSDNSALEILSNAYNNGLRILDTAEVYGTSERIIGNFHKTTGKKFSIITKFYSRPDIAVKIQIGEALQRLEKENIEVFQLHSYQDLIKYPQVLDDLCGLRREGLINKIGISLYSNNEIEDVLSNKYIDVIQVPFNLLDNDFHRGFLLKEAKKLGKIIHVRSVFLQGLFFKETNELPITLYPLKSYLRDLKDLAFSNRMTLTELSLLYPISKEYIDGVIVGVESIMQLRENIISLNKIMPKSIEHTIDQIKFEFVDLLNPSNW